MVAEEGRSLSFEGILVYTVSSRADKSIYKKKKLLNSWVMVVHTFSPGTWGGRGRQISIKFKTSWSTKRVTEQQELLYREIPWGGTTTNKQTKKMLLNI